MNAKPRLINAGGASAVTTITAMALVLATAGCGIAPRAMVANYIKTFPGRLAVSVGDITPEGSWDINGQEAFPAGDAISVFVLVELLARTDAGELTLETLAHLSNKQDQADGKRPLVQRGPLSFLSSVKEMSLRDLAIVMMAEGDTRATNTLIEALGLEKINARAKSLGAVRTAIVRRLGSEAPPENYTCAADLVAAWRVLGDADSPWPGVRKLAAPILTMSRSTSRSVPVELAASDMRISYDGDSPGRGALVHCSGVLYLPGRQVAVAVMGERLGSTRIGETLVAEISKLVHTHYEEEARRDER